MIQLIEGPPRSGKSYMACDYLFKFCRYDDFYEEYVLNSEVLVISNIEGLKIKHWKLDEILKTQKLVEFFTMKNFENILKTTRKSHVIVIVDEAHKIFPANLDKTSCATLYNFFAEHGHIGLDIMLMTQGIQSLTRLFNPLIEFVVKVGIRSKAVGKCFSYTFVDMKGNYLYPKVLIKNQKVFGMYKSFRHDEKNKPKNAIIQWIIVTATFFTIAAGIFYYAVHTVKKKSEAAKVESIEKNTKDKIEAAKLAHPNPANAPIAPVVPEVVPDLEPQPVASDPVQWRTYHVEGFLTVGQTTVYIINGKRIGSERTRNFDSALSMIEFYGLEIPKPSSTYAARASESPPLTFGGLDLPDRAGALASAADDRPSIWIPPDPVKKYGIDKFDHPY